MEQNEDNQCGQPAAMLWLAGRLLLGAMLLTGVVIAIRCLLT